MLNAGSVTVNLEARVLGFQRDLRRASEVLTDFSKQISSSATRLNRLSKSTATAATQLKAISQEGRVVGILDRLAGAAGRATVSLRSAGQSAKILAPALSGIARSGGAVQVLDRLAKSSSKVSPNLTKASKGINATATAMSRLGQNGKSVQTLDRLAIAANRTSENLKRTTASATRTSESLKGIVQEGRSVQVLDRLGKAGKRAADGLRQAGSTAKTGEVQIRGVGKAATSTSTSLSKLAKSANSAGRSFGTLGNQAKRGLGQVSQASASTSNSLRNLVRTAATLGGAFTAISAVRDITQVSAEFRGIELALKTLTGSSDAAAEQLAFLRAETNRLGVSTLDAARNYQSLIASTRGTSITLEDTQTLFQGISEAGRVLGLDNFRLSRTFSAITQVASKGTVSMEELRQQLGEQLPGAMQVAARSMGLTTEALINLVSSGGLQATEFLPRFGRQLRKEFGGAATDASKLFDAALGRVGNALTELRRQLGDFITRNPAIVQLLETITASTNSFVATLRDNAGDVNAFVSSVARIGQGIIGGADTVKDITSFEKAFVGLTEVLRSEAVTRPLRQIGDAFGAIRTAIQGTDQLLDRFGTSLSGLASTAKTSLGVLLNPSEVGANQGQRLAERILSLSDVETIQTRAKQIGISIANLFSPALVDSVSAGGLISKILPPEEVKIATGFLSEISSSIAKVVSQPFVDAGKTISELGIVQTGIEKVTDGLSQGLGIKLTSTVNNLKPDPIEVELQIGGDLVGIFNDREEIKVPLSVSEVEQISGDLIDVVGPVKFPEIDPGTAIVEELDKELSSIARRAGGIGTIEAKIKGINDALRKTERALEDAFESDASELSITRIENRLKEIQELAGQSISIKLNADIANANSFAQAIGTLDARMESVRKSISATEQAIAKAFELGRPQAEIDRLVARLQGLEAVEINLQDVKLEADNTALFALADVLGTTEARLSATSQAVSNFASALETEVGRGAQASSERIAELNQRLQEAQQLDFAAQFEGLTQSASAIDQIAASTGTAQAQFDGLQQKIEETQALLSTAQQLEIKAGIDIPDEQVAALRERLQNLQGDAISVNVDVELEALDAADRGVQALGINANSAAQRVQVLLNAIQQTGMSTALTSQEQSAAIAGYRAELRQAVELQRQLGSTPVLNTQQMAEAADQLRSDILPSLEQMRVKLGEAIERTQQLQDQGLVSGEEAAEKIRQLNEEFALATPVGQAAFNSIQQAGSQLESTMEGIIQGTERAEDAVVKLGLALVKSFANEILKQQLKKLAQFIGNIAGGIAGGAASSAGGGSTGFTDTLAKGGKTSGPQVALIGDNPSGRELVLPSERLSPEMEEFLTKNLLGNTRKIGLPRPINVDIPKLAKGGIARGGSIRRASPSPGRSGVPTPSVALASGGLVSRSGRVSGGGGLASAVPTVSFQAGGLTTGRGFANSASNTGGIVNNNSTTVSPPSVTVINVRSQKEAEEERRRITSKDRDMIVQLVQENLEGGTGSSLGRTINKFVPR